MNKLYNHYSPTLSELDLKMIKSVPPGGNWKNIPLSVPSKRLEQIREGFKAGKGSRSTYYGRLDPKKPAYTISTYFNRPGNGCFVHYDYPKQHRMISQREAARLQSFPDDFEFIGSKTAINKQIGNAVPPLFAYQIASLTNEKGYYIDLFSGAGGLSKGFDWAGWQQIVGSDIDRYALETYKRNLRGEVILGDITDPTIYEKIVTVAKSKLTHLDQNSPFVVLGGPPCQGFSTAGNKRSMQDERNHLFVTYSNILKDLQPDAFLFENVMGLKSMEGGQVLKLVHDTLESAGYDLEIWEIAMDEYGIPQKRKRIMLVGKKNSSFSFLKPSKKTSITTDTNMFTSLKPPISVESAIGDLPSLEVNEDGSGKPYGSNPTNDYQKLMRGLILPSEYIDNLILESNVECI